MQPAVASAPDDEKQGLALLTSDERKAWDEAVGTYTRGLSGQTSMFSAPLAPMTISLSKTGDVQRFPVATWAGAFSYTGRLMILSSNAYAQNDTPQ